MGVGSAMVFLESFAQGEEASADAGFDGAEWFASGARDFFVGPAAEEGELQGVRLFVGQFIDGGCASDSEFIAFNLRFAMFDLEAGDFSLVSSVRNSTARAGAKAI